VEYSKTGKNAPPVDKSTSLTKPFSFASISGGNIEFLDGGSASSAIDDLSKFIGNVAT
jgi:hypothetical protein